MPTVSFFLSTTGQPIDEHHPLWHRPLPDNRLPGTITPGAVDTEAVTYGSYFSAVSQFCAAAGWDRVLKAASRKLEQSVVEKDLARLSIFLEKHGAFYHPARLQVAVKDQTLSFVVNVAASSHGRRALPCEVKALERLNDQRPFGWFPKVYACASVELPMFLGDWFDGFHEFHLTRRPGSDEPAIVVWDGAADPCLLSEGQMMDLYREAAMILTACYDPITTCQIFPWHHAAGDFVVKIEEKRASVRLITVRDYAPMVGPTQEPADEGALLDALVLFFIHLTIRMRLDRLDGVGAVVWAPACSVDPVVDGFFQGLDLTARMSGFPAAFPEIFRRYFNHHATVDLLTMAHHITKTVFNNHTEERRVADRHLNDHIHGLCRTMAG